MRVERGYLYEEFVEGRVFVHHWGRTLTTTDNTLFVGLTMQYNSLYSNHEYAVAMGYPTCPIHPLLVFNTVLGLSVEDLSERGGPFLGAEDLRFPRQVFPGDTITASSRVIVRRLSDSRPGWGIVTWATQGTNQRGEMVVEYRRSNLSRQRAKAA